MGSSGKLLTATDIPDGLIMNADVNAGAGILISKLAPLTANQIMRSNGTANFSGLLQNAEIGAQVIRGGVDGASSRVAPGSLNSLDLAAGTIGAYDFSAGWGGSSYAATSLLAAPPYGNIRNYTSTAGGLTCVLFFAALRNDGGGILAVGVQVDGNVNYGGPAWTQSQPLNQSMTGVMMMVFTHAGAHSYRPYMSQNAGSTVCDNNGQLLILELKR